MSESLHWEAHFWAGGPGRARPGHLGLLELQNSESHSRFCDLYLSPCWKVKIFIKIYGLYSARFHRNRAAPNSKTKCEVSS